jgi:putative glutamine amidotransferase
MDAIPAVPVDADRGVTSVMNAPRIGVTGMWSNKIHGMRFHGSAVAVQVLRSVVRAGGEPLTLFAESSLTPAERVRQFDGILIPGGADLLPSTYGASAHELTQPADYAGQDAFEAEILRAAIAAGIPVLAICRGFQLFNAISGGTLNQHIGDETNPHRNSLHPVLIDADSRLRQILGENEITVSSYHHQAVEVVAPGLRVTATAPDGIVEGLEHESAPLVAIQWHPEDDAETNPQQQALFDWLINESRNRTREITV